jgi:hypothetical protein
MQSFIRIASLLVTVLCAIPVQAQRLDQMLSVQAATTSVGRNADSTTLAAAQGQGLWSSRTFAAKASQSCVAGSPSAVGLASGGTGITNVDIRNAKGEVSITWNFGKGIPAARLPFSAFEVDVVNTSQVAEIAVRTVAILSTNVTDITIGYPGVRVDRKISPHGKVVPFRFENASPALLNHPSTVIRSLTLRLSSPVTCDTSFAVQSARFIPRTADKSKSRSSGKASRASANGDDGPPVEGTAVVVKTPAPNPCEEDPTVPDQIRACEERHNFIAAECASWKCTCSLAPDKKSYYISASTGWSGSSSSDPTGKTCTNNVCGGIPGKCSDFGECVPAQFYGYDNPSISVGAEGVSYRLNDPQTTMDSDCFDERKQPQATQLCSMTIAQVEESFLASMTVGAPCEISPGKSGVCSNFGQCVPDVNATYFCRDQVDCTPCGAKGNLCWRRECLSLQEASRKLCEDTSIIGGGRGVCSPCFAMFKINSDGECGTGLMAPDMRGVSMDGASCIRYRGTDTLRGQCLNGQCAPRPQASPSPVASTGK